MKTMLSMGLRYDHGTLLVLDQTRLPHEEVWINCHTPEQMVELIQRLAIRGAPLIGVAAALALGHYVEGGASLEQLAAAAAQLRAARPTAVNLMWAMDKLVLKKDPAQLTPAQIAKGAEEIFEQDVALCEGMASLGAELIEDGDAILTHCNTGGLATAGIGTALGVIKRAHEQGKKLHVYVDETRPLLQGARLTTWELGKLGIPFTLICDNMAGFLMSQGKVNRIFVGADRIARNGDFANKIGTYSLAVLAKHHQVPFYTVAPETTLDLNCPSGKEIPIEERQPQEVRGTSAPLGCQSWNPSFDVTPSTLLSGIVLNTKRWSPPFAS